MNTYEIFTKKYSKIIQAEHALIALFKFIDDMEDANHVKDVIAIVDVNKGKEFINGKTT